MARILNWKLKEAERDPPLWPRYEKLRNRVASQLKTAAVSYYNKMIHENLNNPEGMWKIKNKELDKHSNHSTLCLLSVKVNVLRSLIQLHRPLTSTLFPYAQN